MSSEERHTWTYLLVAFVVPAVYFGYLVGQARHTAAVEVAYQRPLLIALGASLVVSIFAQAIVTPSGKADRRDQRDRDINRHGEYIGFYVLAVGVLPAFALAMLEAPHFWIANAIYLAYVLNALTSSVAKIVAYRRGL